MSATVIETLDDNSWTDVSTASGLTGFISNTGAQEVIYIEAASLPAATVKSGHKLKPGDSINYTITTGAIYARTILRSGGVLAVTGA